MSMSNASVNDAETQFDYWEFVHCSICFLPFISDFINAPTGPPIVPFWLTGCGHILCNNHINPDQSCGACGTAAVQLVPLQHDMLPPTCDWFRSIPHGLDTLANAAKFQQETLASLVRFYKRKFTQQRAIINKSKDAIAENKALRNQIDQLQQENAQLRAGGNNGGSDRRFDQRQQQHVFSRERYENTHHDGDRSYETNDFGNANGKRTLSTLQSDYRTSSPRSITTPIGPPRLTLDHQKSSYPNVGAAVSDGQIQHSYLAPGTRTFEQYTYQAQATPLRPAPLRHRQQHYLQNPHQQTQQQEQQQPQQQQQESQTVDTRQKPSQLMLPPPTPLQSGSRTQRSTHSRVPFRPAGQIVQQNAQRMQPPMPPTPATTSHSSRPTQPFPMSIPSSHGQEQTMADTRFVVPPTPSNRFFTPRPTAPNIGSSRTPAVSGSNVGSTRASFVPGGG